MTRTHWCRAVALATLGAVLPVVALPAQQAVPLPRDVIGFEPGTDYKLFGYTELLTYLQELDAASDRVEVLEIGETVLGRPLPLVLISSAENLRQRDRYRSISERLAKGRDLSDEEAHRLAQDGKVVLFIDGGIHSSEVAGHQRMPLLAYRLATEETEEVRRIRDNVILLLMPVMNPDGMDMVEDWYMSNVGTPFETARMPVLYHHYVGHDNNRDWAMMTQVETQAVSRVLYEAWFPQIMFNVHQTGPFPSRIELPPFGDPVNPNVHPLLTRSVNLIGSHQAKRFEEERKPGVIQRWHYDMWRADGVRFTGYGHNIVGVHTETNLYRYATPKYYPTESIPDWFSGRGQPVSAKHPSIFYSNPWLGGWWRLRDAVDYMLTADMGVLDIAARMKEDWLYNCYTMGRDAIANENGAFAYVIPAEQWDGSEALELMRVLRRGGAEVHLATSSFVADGETYDAGSYVVYGAQAIRPWLALILEKQVYPDRRAFPGGPPVPPYDLAGWTFPIAMNVHLARVEQPFQARTEVVDQVTPSQGQVAGESTYGYLLSPRQNISALAVNQFLAAGDRVSRAGAAFDVGSEHYEAGTFIAERRRGTESRVDRLAEEFGLDFVGVTESPDVTLHPLREARIGLYKSWVANMAEGWMRWLLANQYQFTVDTLHDADIKSGDLSDYDVILLPDQRPAAILNGHLTGTMPSQYVGGLGAEGAAVLKQYVMSGGRVVAFDKAADFAIQQFGLPVRNAVTGLTPEQFFIPGSLIRLTVDNTHALAYGMPSETAALFARSRAFSVVPAAREGDQQAPAPPVELVARYADSDLLLSGWEIGAQRYLANRAAVVRVGVGGGDVVLFGFRPEFRAYPRATYKLLFNAIFGAGTVTR